MRALTIRQPYADAIVWGTKRTENRSRPIPAAHLGTTILIHAAKAPHASGVVASDFTNATWPDTRSAIIGTAVLDSCHQATDDCCTPWGVVGHWHWQLRDCRPLLRPVPAAGALGLWAPSHDVLYDVQVQFWEPTQTAPAGAAS
ncbi:hypothetical protein ACFY8X_38610 [Streptomyces tanashiensis]|jgi:hypothetical protein|uniref:hypothetical protein n=1 Tax=Streptomyces tanashiensis TaxID=67367 RepID=UPI0036E1C382